MHALAPMRAGQLAIPSPEVTQVMVDALQLKPGDKVLEIGTGSGFQTWRLGVTGAEVYSIELVSRFLPVDEFKGVHFRVGDGSLGFPEHAPYDAVFASCGVLSLPQAWIDQLGHNGRLVAPVGDVGVQKLILAHKSGNELLIDRVLAYVKFTMMDTTPPEKPVKPRYETHAN